MKGEGGMSWVLIRYIIIANLDKRSPSLLVDGQPQSDSVAKNQYRYYQKHVGIEEGAIISFTLSPTSGDPDLYLTTSREREPGR